MGFKKLINSKKALSLVAAFLLLGTNVLMAQGTTGADPKAADSTSKADMWLGVGYYVLLVLLACVIVAVVGKILRVYDLSLQMQGKKGMNWNNVIGVILCHIPCSWFIWRLLVIYCSGQYDPS
jgi:cytochrome c oxidase subunit 2